MSQSIQNCLGQFWPGCGGFTRLATQTEVLEINLAADLRGGPADNSCYYSSDGDCDDGGPGSEYVGYCQIGTDCQDCGDCKAPGTTRDPEPTGTTMWFRDEDQCATFDAMDAMFPRFYEPFPYGCSSAWDVACLSAMQKVYEAMPKGPFNCKKPTFGSGSVERDAFNTFYWPEVELRMPSNVTAKGPTKPYSFGVVMITLGMEFNAIGGVLSAVAAGKTYSYTGGSVGTGPEHVATYNFDKSILDASRTAMPSRQYTTPACKEKRPNWFQKRWSLVSPTIHGSISVCFLFCADLVNGYIVPFNAK